MRCKSILGHRWSNWGKVKTAQNTFGLAAAFCGIDVQMYQERSCDRCGLVQRNIIINSTAPDASEEGYDTPSAPPCPPSETSF
jgi:hypothetical protein